METPSARGRDAAMLQRQLDAGQMHRRRVSRSMHLDDSFFTSASSPPGFTAPQTRYNKSPQQSPREASPATRSYRFDSSDHSPKPKNEHPGVVYGSQGLDELVFDSRYHGFSTPAAQKNGRQERIFTPQSDPRAPQRTPLGSPSRSPARALSSRRRCAKCDGDISGHFVRALGASYHIDCFTCGDCNTPCAAKFFPVDNIPLCEHCYFKRQNLLCYRCGNSLRGSYITALDRKYHVEHFTCSLCTTVFGADDSYFEYNGDVYCRAHYSSLFAFHCEGCNSPILKQFVETYRGGKKQQWHPECYMIFKFWSVKISDVHAKEIDKIRKEIAKSSDPSNPLDKRALEVISHEEMVDRRTMKTWTTLCGYEEACAAEISALVQRAVNGEFRAAYNTCSLLVAQIKVLFTALEAIPKTSHNKQGSSLYAEEQKEPGKEAKTLCRKVVSTMSLLSKTRDLPARERMQGLAKDLLALASAMAHYLKVLIRQGLAGALDSRTLDQFLTCIGQYSTARPAKAVSPFSTDQCVACNKAVEDKCYRQVGRNDRLWHARRQCFKCTRTQVPLDPTTATIDEQGNLISTAVAQSLSYSQPQQQQQQQHSQQQIASPPPPRQGPPEFISIGKLEQYVILLHVALARLDLVLTNNKRSKSQESSPIPSERPSQEISSASTPILPGQRTKDMVSSNAAKQQPGIVPTALERTSIILHGKAGLTLDDIRRIVAAEQAKGSSDMPKASKTQAAASALQPQGAQSLAAPANRKFTRYYGTLTDEEYDCARQISQSLLQPYCQKYLKRDLETISSNSKTPTLWDRMGKVFTKDQEGRVFGQPLNRLVAKYGVDSNLVALDPMEAGQSAGYTLRIPGFVDDCIMAMRQKDMSAEGIFRKNGNIRRLREFVEKIDRNPEETGLLVDESPIQLAALLKKFLRDLPDPLLCSKLSPLWTILPKLEQEERTRITQLLIAALPRPNRSLLEVLTSFLNWVSSFAHVDDDTGSKMDISNLATVLGPTLMLSNEEADSLVTSQGTAPDSSSSFREPIKYLITDFRMVAQLPEDVVQFMNQLKATGQSRKLNAQETQEILRKKAA